ncbi:PREDICTED: uncharacterized protein LOC104803346 [Tarenaya hassleriana]|uniref:uncharacterized protein LOC104803346 n=1 Tax=Tarenaya hassleriana TaxID=28532 RepID=UPI00053C1651|nr:PREDICTED: uncharacterized protein LOC104803346 [Tarenaya hassleriana]
MGRRHYFGMILGPLIRFVGEAGPRNLRLPLLSTVSEAVRDSAWTLPAIRSDRLQEVLTHLSTIVPPSENGTKDQALWKYAEDDYKSSFSTVRTWNFIRNPHETVHWRSTVWFKQSTPRMAIFMWQMMHVRLPTKDRLMRWGVASVMTCGLCDAEDESHNHLFFECRYSAAVWSYYACLCWPNPPINNPANDVIHNRKQIAKILLQVTAYTLWKERHNRIFRSQRKSMEYTRWKVDRIMQTKLLSLTRKSNDDGVSMLSDWYFLTMNIRN